jgi:hypothetical protein
MIAIRKISQRLYVSLPSRYQSSTTNDLIKTSSGEIERTPKIDANLWATSETNRLIDYLSQRIQNIGPITVADFMREALVHPKYVRNSFHSVYL